MWDLVQWISHSRREHYRNQESLPPPGTPQMNESKSHVAACSTYFYASVAVLLLITGAIKAAGIAYGFKGMKAGNSVIPLFSNMQMICLSAIIEVAVGSLLLLVHDLTLRRVLVYWIVSLFLAYRLGLVIVGDYSGCGCLRGLSLLLDSNKGLENAVAMSILVYMVMGNIVFHLLTTFTGLRETEH